MSAAEQIETSTESAKTDAAPVDNMSFGAYLTRAREARGLSMDDLAHQTKIRRAIIEALETNARRDLPEKVFVLGYVRSYAIAVNLNVEDTLHRFNLTWTDEAQAVGVEETKGTGRSFAWLPPALAAVFAASSFWYILHMH